MKTWSELEYTLSWLHTSHILQIANSQKLGVAIKFAVNTVVKTIMSILAVVYFSISSHVSAGGFNSL